MGISYFGQKEGLDTVPDFVSARTPLGLRRAMFLNNKKQKGFVVYQDVSFVKGKWYAWYYVKLKTEDVLNTKDR